MNPSSIAIIPDGNRRYAAKHSLSLEQSYRLGFDKAEEVFDWCLALPEMKTATVYALSTENLSRSNAEISILNILYREYLSTLAENKKIHKNRVRVRVIGDSKSLGSLQDVIKRVQDATSAYDSRFLNVALGYGGRAEIIDAVKTLVSMKADMTKLDEKTFASCLYTPTDVDLLIRTGSTHRLSNFMPWQATYAELYFSDKLWPEFDKKEFDTALEFYAQTKRNFGK